MSADDRPSLRAVSDKDAPRLGSEDSLTHAAAEPRHQQPWLRIGDWSWLSVLLGVALLVACLGYVYQQRRASEFETQAMVLQTEVEEARQDIRAHEERIRVVRGHVDDLAGRLGLLQQVIAADAEPE